MDILVKNSLDEAYATMRRFVSTETTEISICKAAELIAASIKAGGRVFTCGNGGSLCDATHFAEELTGRFRTDRQPYPAVAINDPAHITCVANDFSYKEIFSRYVMAAGAQGDILICFSTSGNSANVVKAAETAKSKGMKVIGMTRAGENALSTIADVAVTVEHKGYSDRIQEMHILAVHIIIEKIEELLQK